MYNSCKFAWFGYRDADISTPLSEIEHLFNYYKSGCYKLIVGTRFKHLGANIKRKAYRHYLGRVFATFASIYLKLPVYDTQCGAKILDSSIIEIVFKNKFKRKWLFYVEIFTRILQYYNKEYVLHDTIEVPLDNWMDIGTSKITIKDIFLIPVSFFKIIHNYEI